MAKAPTGASYSEQIYYIFHEKRDYFNRVTKTIFIFRWFTQAGKESYAVPISRFSTQASRRAGDDTNFLIKQATVSLKNRYTQELVESKIHEYNAVDNKIIVSRTKKINAILSQSE